MRIGMVGSRHLTMAQRYQFADLARCLAQAGHTIVSGGCPTGADAAALDGAIEAVHAGHATHPVLYLSANLHRVDQYLREAECHMVDAHWLQSSILCSRCHPGRQPDTYTYGYFRRNAAIALNSDVLIALPGPGGGTRHTMRCMVALNRPVTDLTAVAPWASSDELCKRTLAWLRRKTATWTEEVH